MSRSVRFWALSVCSLLWLIAPAFAEREINAPSKPEAEILVDSKASPRTMKSTQPFLVTKEDFGRDDSLRLVFQAPGYARQARFLNRSILDQPGIFDLSETLLYRQQVQLKYNAYPPDAALSLEEISAQGMKPHYLGQYPQLNVADRYDLSRGKFLNVHLLLEREGYEPWRRKVALNSLAEPGKDIAFLGDIELKPMS